MKRTLFVFATMILFACNSANEETPSSSNSEPNSGETSQTSQQPTSQVPETNATQGDPIHTSSLSVDWTGTYSGTIPCDDCEGIETTITLNNDLSFTAKAVYLGKSGEPYLAQGTFKWLDDGARIKMIGIDPSFMHYIYQVGENRITCLDASGSPISGKLASRYTLAKN